MGSREDVQRGTHPFKMAFRRWHAGALSAAELSSSCPCDVETRW